jgi:hypothetical protein
MQQGFLVFEEALVTCNEAKTKKTAVLRTTGTSLQLDGNALKALGESPYLYLQARALP